jgi:lipoprotein-anchoring transpeptidase ErfK/SrfK
MRIRHFLTFSAVALVLGGATLAHAETPQPNYGGGFIETLMTGRTTAPQARMQVASSRGVIYATPDDDDGNFQMPTQQPMRARSSHRANEAHMQQREVPAEYRRQIVPYVGNHRAGTIIVDTGDRFLYLVQNDGTAIRYGVGVGRPGFTWSGVKSVTRKAEWPDWRPPSEMLKRRPDLPAFMAGGVENPLGARALYLGSSLYRIHGTNEPHTIGQNVSSGCIRMTNEDVTDLYSRVRVGTRVVVL